MADSALRRRLWVFTMQGEDLPQARNRVDLDPAVRDAWGLPAGRVTYAPHRHELAASDHAAPLHEAVMLDAGARGRLLGHLTTAGRSRPPRHRQPARHRARQPPRHGHRRMGTDPATSVVSPEQRLWDVDNLLVCDSSVFVTAAGYNPTLTLAALAHRAASALADRRI